MSNRPTAKGKIQYGDSPTTAKNAPTSPKAGSDSGPIGAKIAIGAALAIALIAIVAFAVKDNGGKDVNNVGFQPVTVTGSSLPATVDSGADSAIGMTVPTLTGKSFDGTKVEIKPGKPMLVAFVAHWCPHCQAEVPKLVTWQAAGDFKGIDVYAVATAADESRGNYPPASWLEKEEWKNPVLVDDANSKALNAWGGRSFPTLVAVKADGTVALRMSGELSEDQIKQLADAARGKAVDTSTSTPATTPLTSPVPTSAP